jgi:trimeric autotransporter adhesin
VFTKSHKGWNQVAELTASDGASGDAFGNAVALSRTGSTIVIGAVIHNGIAGSAYVFARSGDSWTQTTELAPSDGSGMAFFGVAVSISSDGSSVLVGAQGQGLGGAAYLFADQGSTWTQTQVVTATDVGAYDAFGSYVALSGDGSTAVIGSPDHAPSGAAYVFIDRKGSWTQTDELTASDSEGFLGFGNRFAVSRTGSVIAVGAVAHSQNTGMTYVFTGSPRAYSQTAELTAKDSAPGDFFGSSVSMSHNGSVLAISADQKNVNTGAEYVFIRDAGAWSQKAELTAPDGAQLDYFGLSTALSSDGSSLFVSSDYHDGSTGAMYVFAR